MANVVIPVRLNWMACAPREAARRDLVQLVADLHRHHAVEHEEHLVLAGVHMEIRSRRERRARRKPRTALATRLGSAAW